MRCHEAPGGGRRPPLQSALLRLLSQWGYATEMATTAGEALGWLERELFDLVLLNLGLPDCDGLSLCSSCAACRCISLWC